VNKQTAVSSIMLNSGLLRLQFYLLVIGIALYNNWLLGIFLNWRLTSDGATISELSVKGQPSAMVFRVLDVLAGLALLGGMGLIIKLAKTPWQKVVAAIAMIAFGLGTIIDALVPLDCSAVLSRTCAQYEQIGRLNGFHLFHISESLLVYALIFLLPLVMLIAYKHEMSPKRFKILGAAIAVSMLLWSSSTVIRYMTQSEAYGYEQRCFTLLFTFWFLYFLIQVKRKRMLR
jgi:hypothetical protein